MTRLLWFLFLVPALAVDSDFGFYPKNAQSCLNDASAKSSCNGASDVADLNQCLCGNDGNFILNTARCLGQKDKGDVAKVYDIMSGACRNSDTPMDVSQKDFYDAANGKETTTTTTSSSTSTSSATSSTSSTSSATASATDGAGKDKGQDKKDSGGLSTGAKIGIAVAGVLIGVGIIAGIAFFVIRRRRNAAVEEKDPMLPQHNYALSQTSPGFSDSGAWKASHNSAAYSTASFNRDSHNYTPATTYSGRESLSYTPQPSSTAYQQGRESTLYPSTHASPELQQGSYVGAFAPPQEVAELPPVTERNEAVYEMDAPHRPLVPAEVQGSTPYTAYRPQ